MSLSIPSSHNDNEEKINGTKNNVITQEIDYLELLPISNFNNVYISANNDRLKMVKKNKEDIK